MAKQVKKWITIEGNHIPIYEDGSLGGAAEKMGFKNTSDFKSKEGKKTFRVKYKDGNQKLLEANSEEELREYLKEQDVEIEQASEYDDKDTLKESDFKSGKDERELIEKSRDNLARETYDGRSYSELNDAQKQSIDEYLSGEESWSKMQVERSTKEASDIFRKQQEKERLAESKKGQSVFGKDIQDKVDTYTDKFLSNKSDKEIEEIKSNLEKSGNIAGTTEQDMVALTAIRQEQERRASSKQSEDNSVAYQKNQTREQALQEIESKLAYNYSHPELTKGDSPVLMEKDGRYSVAKNWDEADYASNYGWKAESIDSDTASKIGDRARIAVQEDKINDIVDRYTTSTPVSGSWDTEGQHLRDTLSKELGISKQSAEDYMVDKLGWDRNEISPEKATSKPHINPVSKELMKDDISIGDGVDPVPSKYNGDEQADAISYMYGVSLPEARQGIVDGKYSDDDIKRSILYQETEDMPSKYRHEAYEKSLKKYGLEKSDKPKEQVQSKSDTSTPNKESYHVEHTDSVGGKFVDGGKVGDYEIGEKVNYLSGDKMKSGTITKAHIYPNGKVDYNVVDADGDGHNVSSKNLAKTDANRTGREAMERSLQMASETITSPEATEGLRKLQERKGSKSIKVGNKQVPVAKNKSVRQMIGDDGDWKIQKAYDRTSLKNLALDAGVSKERVNSMSTDELRKMLLSMWRK